MKTLILIHKWTGDTKEVAIEYYDAKIVSIRWPLSGTYDLNLKTNVLRSRSERARRKQHINLWQAENIEELRRRVWEWLNPDHREREQAYKLHMAKLAKA